MNKKLNEIYEAYNAEISSNDFKENEKAIELRKEYDQINLVVRDRCDECGGLAKVTCNYH